MTDSDTPSAADAEPFVGIDVGGTKILGVVVDAATGSILESRQVETPRGGTEMTTAIGDLAEGLISSASPAGIVRGIGIGVPGLVDHDGVLRYGPNVPGLLDFAIGPPITKRLGLPVAVENDGFNAAVAEHRYGAAKKANNAVIATQGTGIGGALLVHGQLVRGANGFAGEPGHMLVSDDRFLCACGQTGCWESFASGTGLANLAREIIAEGKGQDLLASAGGDVESLRGEHVSAALSKGDSDAREVIERFSFWVARGLGSLISILDPEVVVLGGGLSAIGDDFRSMVQDRLMQSVVGGPHRPMVPVVSAHFGPEAGALGAALNAEDATKSL